VVDYHAMQNSQAAMDLKARVLPPELKQLEQALRTSGLDENHDIEELAFASFKAGGDTRIVAWRRASSRLTTSWPTSRSAR